MEISGKKQRNTIIFAVLTLLIIGLSLVCSTWQILRQQEEASLQYMNMSAHSISEMAESTLRRSLVTGFPGEVPGAELRPSMEGFFAELESGSDLLFVELINAQGLHIIASRAAKNKTKPFSLPDTAFAEVGATGEWQGVIVYEKVPVFVYARTINPLVRKRVGSFLIDEGKSLLVVGLSMQKHQSLYASFRHNAMLQSLYLLVAAIFLWGMAVALISRRELAGRTKFLERFQAQLLDNMPDGLITVGPDAEIQSVNHSAYTFLELPAGSLAGKAAGTLPTEIAALLQDNGSLPCSAVEWSKLELGGRQLEILVSCFQDENNMPVKLLLIRDRTRVHKLERSLADAEKMAAVGTLAAGVAHEVRNPLAALRGFAQYFSKKFKGVQPEEEFASTMVREADRLNRVITSLLYLSRPTKMHFTLVDLEQLSSEVGKLLQFELAAHSIQLKYNLLERTIIADEDAVKQALINLVLNSIDAIAERKALNPDPDYRGQICISSAPVKACTGAENSGTEPCTVLRVEDNGVGMDAERAGQAFEAFYTGKTKGTGLGLALVDKTMQGHGSRAGIESELQNGCKVSLFFPCNNEQVNEDSTDY